MAGYNQDVLKEYVPALVYTMYDGYYIYSPYTNTLPAEDQNPNSTFKNNDRISGLKPYIYYSCRYIRGADDFVITYSLDNYITIQGTIGGKAVFDYGYLLNDVTNNGTSYRGVTIGTETLKENTAQYEDDTQTSATIESTIYTKINGVKYYYDDKNGGSWYSILNGERYKQENYKQENTAAIQYYKEAEAFKKRVNDDYKLNDLSTANAVDEKGQPLKDKQGNSKFGTTPIFKFNDNGVAIEESNSNFNQHRLAVIRYSIEKNLSVAIANYNNYGNGNTTNFQMPTLKEEEWEKIINNISIISFLQGLNIGGKVYNGYSIITNTKNEEVVSEDSIYITTSDEQYHKPTDSDLLNNAGIETGALNVDFERKALTNAAGTSINFFPRMKLGCYSSIVNQNNVNATDNIYDYMESIKDKGKLAQTYFTALGRERYSMYKTNNNPELLQKQFQ